MADETDLRLYPVEHDLRGPSAAQLADVHRAPDAAVRREIRRGSHIRYEHRCLCLFESVRVRGPDLVSHVNDVAQFPLARVVACSARHPAGTAR